MPAPRSSARTRFEPRYRARVAALDGELTQFVHVPTGARHLHLDAPLDDNAFVMAFLTPAPDSSGLTHVLEHMVWCGSERFPCRRAFFAMLGRTLSTTMNAATTEDCTTFHFATRSLPDYENLLAVHLDAAFFPRLDRLDFEQEGCRVEIDGEGERGEAKAPERRGVVLSEMRGVMSEPERPLEQALNRRLFPGAPYRFNAGGDPRAIPALDYETLKAYHRRHYRPANAIFLSAGPLRPEWLHDRLRDLALDRVPCRRPDAAPRAGLREIPPLRAPARSVVRYPGVRTGEREPAAAGVALGWRLGEAREPIEAVRARFLAACLLERADAPLHHALLEASGATAVAFGSHPVQAARPRLALRCGVLGCDPDLAGEIAGEIEARVMTAVDRVACHGLDPAVADAALARIERELLERHDPRFPYPLKLLTRMLPVAMYGGEPAAALDPSAALAALRTETRSRSQVAALVRRCLRDNPERVLVTAISDPAAARRLDADDRAALERAYGPSRPQARRRLVERSRALRRRQASSSGESSLPRIGPDQVGPARERPELIGLSAGESPAWFGRRREGMGTAEAGSPSGSSAGSPAGPSSGSPAGSSTGSSTGSPAGSPSGSPSGSSAGSPSGSSAGSPSGSSAGSPSGSSAGSSAGSPAGPSSESSSESPSGSRSGGPVRADADAGGAVEAPRPAGAAGAPRVWLSRGATGGLVYARLAVDLPDLGIEALDDVVLLAEILPRSSHGGLGPDETRVRIARICDRIAVEPWVLARGSPGPSGPPGSSGPDGSGGADPRPLLLLSARSRSSDEDMLLRILADAHLRSRFDGDARAAAASAHARRRRELAGRGHLHAERIAGARLDPWGAVAERWHGPSALALLARAAEDGNGDRSLAERLRHVHRALSAAPCGLHVVRDRDERPNGDPGRAPSGHAPGMPAAAMPVAPRGSSEMSGMNAERAGGHGIRLPDRPAAPRVSATGAWIGEGPVGYCARVHPAVAADHPDAGPLAVLAAFLGGDLLQRAVRERGGAYGAGARYCARSCTVRMFSYRDPRLAGTLRDFEGALESLRRHPPRGRSLEEAIVRAVREIDRPKAFQVDALERYLDELQGPGSGGGRALRDAVLGTRPERLRDVAERYLSPDRGCVGVLAGAGRESELERLGLPWRRLPVIGGREPDTTTGRARSSPSPARCSGIR